VLYPQKKFFDNELNVVNVIKFRGALNVLLLATLAMIGTFLSGYKKEDRDNEAGSNKDSEASSSREIICKKPKCRKYDMK
jgi:hypothetical protein